MTCNANHDTNPKMNVTNVRYPMNEPSYHNTSHETYLHAHQPNYYLNFHVTLYFVKYNNSIPFSKQWLLQLNQSLFDCYNIQSHSM